MLKHPSGYQYSYLDSVTAAACPLDGSCWRHGLTMLNPNPVSHTLLGLAQQPEQQQQQPLAYAIYNDADPAGQEHWGFAHAKGVVGWDSNSGFWLQHSAPRFPGWHPSDANFSSLGRGQSVFGQHFFCATLGASGSSNSSNSSVAVVAQHLAAAGPYFYAWDLPAPLAAAFPDWQQLLLNSSNASSAVPRISRQGLVTAGGAAVSVFAKTAALNASLEDWVVPLALGAPMLWETWRRGHDALASVCPPAAPFASSNIDAVRLPNSSIGWGWAADHSKWGVTAPAATHQQHRNTPAAAAALQVACLGDMNRARWQQQRGGGYLCLHHSGLWAALHGMVTAVQPCKAGVQAGQQLWSKQQL